MTETVHIIPVGFDYERLLHPISKGELHADRVRLVRGVRSDTAIEVRRLTERMIDELEYTLDSHLEVDVNLEDLEELYDYRAVYRSAYDMLTEEVEEGNTVWINISSMPRTVAFAFATAANSYIVENPSDRELLHTYYVRPEKYFAPEMLGELQNEVEFLEHIEGKIDDPEVSERLRTLESLVNEIERSGITKGAKRMDDGKLYVEFPASPLPNLRDFEIAILKFLAKEGSMPSTSQLAREFGEQRGISSGSDDFESFRSKVQYNVDNLEDKGYIRRQKENNKFETRLSVAGELWVETNTEPVVVD